MGNKHSAHIGILQMTVCATLWSIAGVFIKFINMSPFVIAGGRSLFAALAVIVYMAVTKQKFILSKSTVINGILLCCTFHCFVGANKMTTAANAIVLQYTAPIFILLFSFLLLHKKPRALDILAVALTFVGIAVFFLDSIDGGKLIGNMLGIGAGIFMGGMFIAVGSAKGDEKMSGILLGHLFCAAVGLPFIAFTQNTFEVRGVLFLAILGVFQLGIPYILYALASGKCSTISCAIIAAIEPVLNPVWVALIYNEIPGPFAIVGGLFLIAVITVYSVLDYRASLKIAI